MKAAILALLASSIVSAAPTFTTDVAPILYRRCVACHRPNDIAPMSLLDYKSARPWAKAIREAVLTRKMPPWFADPHWGSFSNDARLSTREIETIQAWVDGGAQEGSPRNLPPAPVEDSADFLLGRRHLPTLGWFQFRGWIAGHRWKNCPNADRRTRAAFCGSTQLRGSPWPTAEPICSRAETSARCRWG